MGGHAYWYYAKYQTDLDTTLQELRQREFLAGRYNPVLSSIDFPITSDSPAPGAQHSSIEEAMEAADASGTRSILDMFQASDISYLEAEKLASSEQAYMELFCTTYPLSTNELIRVFNTDKPTHEMVEVEILLERNEASGEFWESIDRGTGRHIVIYEDNMPVEVFFVGYSFD